MKLKALTTCLLLATSAFAQDFERVAPKEPKEFDPQRGKLYGPSGDLRELPDGDKVVVPDLAGILLMDKNSRPTESDLHQAAGRVETLNIKLPGKLKALNSMLAKKYFNKPLTKQDLLELKQDIIFYYRERGRPVITLDIPQQKISSGVLQIIVIEGKLGKVTVEGNKYFKSETLKDYIRLEEGETIDSEMLITDLDWMNRNPFRQVDVIYGPGQIVGTTDIRLLTTDRRPWRVYGGVDNTGYDETEKTRIFAGANFGNAFGLDHQFSFQFTTAPDIHRFWSITGNYVIPLPWRNLWKFYGGFSKVHPTTSYPGVRNSGYSAQASTRYNFILRSFTGFLQDIEIGFDYKRTNNNLTAGGHRIYRQSINLTQFALVYNSAYDSEWVKCSFTVEFYYSPGTWLPEQSKSDYENVRYKGNPHYYYARGTLAPIFRLPRDFALAITLRGQVSNRNLLASEQYGLGGYNSVRGYKERVLNVDDAFLANIELRTPPIPFPTKNTPKSILQFLAFLDYGTGKNNHPTPLEKEHQYLLGAGPGVRYDLSPYINFRGDFGVQLHKLHKHDKRDYRFHFAAVASY